MAKQQFKRLGLFYLIALGGIALSIIISQILIQTSINRQQDDAHVINVAGRQRMLSQKISKVSLKIAEDSIPNPANFAELKTALELWNRCHLGLQHGDTTLQLGGKNSAVIVQMFATIEPHFQIILRNAQEMITLWENDPNTTHFRPFSNQILAHEADFLVGMDRIVFQYDREAQEKVRQLKQTEIYLFVLSLFIIILELLFIFRPLANSVKATVDSLMVSENESKQLASELSKLYEELGKSFQDLEAVNIKPESPALYATFDLSGYFLQFSSRLKNMMEYSEQVPPRTFQELLSQSGYQQDFINSLMTILNQPKNWTGELRLLTEPGDFCWIEAFLIPVQDGSGVKMIARNITELKEAKIRSRELNRERIEKSVREQHYRSALILEGQEEERKRLSRELHDGVGQMLSAMKMLLESFTVSSKPMKIRLEDAKDLMKSIIQEVRRVSFNLTPSSLDDFGLVPAVKKFCEEINAVTKTQVEFVNETSFINRLESAVETNLYRIIQEAVNNALKYAKATAITVRFAHSINTLHISIQDNGRGFDYQRVLESGHFEKTGHGIFNMKERTAYIGGVFKLETEPEKGTSIHITLSLDKND